MFLAWEAGLPCGIAGVFDDGGRCHLISMWTDPAARNRGVARALLDAVVAFARGRELVLGVTEGNDVARRLYERYGFVDTGASEPLRPGSALVVHELRLSR
jgi:ribosomal protein S18 acetylase RimI-like enzyme